MIPIHRRMSKERALEILRESKYGILSTVSKENIPYGVAINYFYVKDENCLYFHTKKVGKKIDNIMNNPNVSLFILGKEKIIPDRYITHYESIIVTGKASLIEDENEIREKLILLCEALAPGALERREAVIQKYIKSVYIGKIQIKDISGKRNNDD